MKPIFPGFHALSDAQHEKLARWRVTRRERVPQHIVTQSRHVLYRFRTHFHPYAERLRAELVERDIAGLQGLDTRAPALEDDQFFQAKYGPNTMDAARSPADLGDVPAAVLSREEGAEGEPARNLLPVKDIDFDYAEGAYAVYNWELFFHVPFTIAVHLAKNHRYAEAQRWFHHIFDPTDTSGDPAPQRFWKVKPLRVDEVEHVEQMLLALSDSPDSDLARRTISAIRSWRDDPFRPHLVARTRPTAYMYATVMAYLDNLIAWGDSLFRQDTRESIQEATQLYVLAANILGPRPEAVPKVGSLGARTYESLRRDLDELGNAARDLEAEIPFDLVPPAGAVHGSSEDGPLESLGRSLYFCVPRNDKLLGYWDTVADRLFKIRNSLNLQGVFRQLPLFAPPIDPALLARAAAAGVDVARVVADMHAPIGPVRFHLLLQKAIEICQEARSLAGQVLAALEKKDGEALSVLRAKHESNVFSWTESVRHGQWQEAIKVREGIEKSLENAFQRYRYHERQLGRPDAEIQRPEWAPAEAGVLAGDAPPAEPEVGLRDIDVQFRDSEYSGGRAVSPHEAEELDRLHVAQGLQDGAAVLESTGAGLNMIPLFDAKGQPFGLGTAVAFGGSNLSGLFSGLASVARAAAGRVSFEAGMSSRVAGFIRREQEWALQANAAAGEINQLQKQLRAAEIREHIAKREHENHQRQMAQARDVEDFLTNERRKTTTEDFYLWMKREAQGLHAQCFQLAHEVAKKAERALQHELGNEGARFVKAAYLSGREGLFAAEKLYLDLKRMEVAYAELNTRELELTKHVSLRDWFPVQLLALRASGECEVTLPEELFDLDCPGHVFRRIKLVAVSIPCVTGPYASVSCGLTLQGSGYRTGRTGEGSEVHPNVRGTIVTSSAQNDAGLFEPNLRDERYLPFEGAGVKSTWSIKLLSDPPQIDPDTIADLVLTIRYTARPATTEAAARGASVGARAWLRERSARLVSMRHELPSEWARFRGSAGSEGRHRLSFTLTEDHFPYRMREDGFAGAKRLHLFVRSAASRVGAWLLRDGAQIGETTLVDGEGRITVEATEGFEPIGDFELQLDAVVEDLWMVVDWSREDDPGPG